MLKLLSIAASPIKVVFHWFTPVRSISLTPNEKLIVEKAKVPKVKLSV